MISDLYDFPARKYHDKQGWWISPDPAGLSAVEPTNPQTWNRYAYVMNNPLSSIDPLGLSCEDLHDNKPCVVEVNAPPPGDVPVTVINLPDVLEGRSNPRSSITRTLGQDRAINAANKVVQLRRTIGNYISALHQAVAAARHLFQLLQPQLEDKLRRKLRHLAQRLRKISSELDRLPKKERTLAS